MDERIEEKIVSLYEIDEIFNPRHVEISSLSEDFFFVT